MTSADAVTNLPPLQPEQAQHGAVVLQAVRAAIAAHGGWLAFDDYLRLVLYAPGLGYYSAGSAKFGSGGDFVTAPELSGLFGHCVARQCAQVLQLSGGDLLELGAGTGALAATVLPMLQELAQLPDHYYILEVSADLRRRQRQRLAGLPEVLRTRVLWLDALPAAPIDGMILANEVADALPFKRFAIAGDGLLERGVALSAQDELIDADRPADAPLRAAVAHIAESLAEPWPDGYQSELCPMLQPWIGALGAALGRGTLLLIDYGLSRREYYHPQRTDGTLRCHFRQRAHDRPLLYPGLQDISAWVDFTRVAEAAVDAALEVTGYCTQAAFLLATGIEADVADVAAGAATAQRAQRVSEARALLMPEAMGENFKVMALTRGIDAMLRGFEYQDLRRSL
jgi:SAM-dependent MidA family methyltransferase